MPTNTEADDLRAAIAALETQRPILGDAVVDAALGPMREKLAVLQAPGEQQRKQVTILFADIVGFTAMSETMDAEDVTEFMNRIWHRLDAIIIEHGGHIDKHIGDAVMAVWGVETAREDDPEQAIRAALVMQEALAEGALAGGVGMRVGLSTGPVLLAEVGTTHEFTAMGDPVNVASRLQNFCPEGSVVISHDTYRHVRGVFDVRALEPVSLKGKAEPVRAYLVDRAKPRAFRMATRGVEGVETRMIGRDRYLQALQDAFLATSRDRALSVITIVGEPGIGKSRLMYEFENWIELQTSEVAIFRSRARLETRHAPYGLWREVFAGRFDIHDDDPLPLVKAKLLAGLREPLPVDVKADLRADILGQWLGYDFVEPDQAPRSRDPRQLQEEALSHMVDYFRAVAANGLVLVLVEDLHWADDSSLDVMARLAQILSDATVLFCSTARPSLYERRPNWFEGRTYHQRIDLTLLSGHDSHLLVDEILRKVDNLPDALRELIVSHSEGNPFYAEELIKVLIERGVIAIDADTWSIRQEHFNQSEVPATLTGVLQSRLDSLSPHERIILQQASVIGRVFWNQALRHLNRAATEGYDETAVDSTLNRLRNRELIYLHDLSAIESADEYTFKHALLHEVTYESVLRSARARYHGLAAEWLIKQTGERVEEVSGLVAQHLFQAGQTERARGYFVRAGDEAAGNFANREAVAYYTRALDLTGDEDLDGQWGLLQARERLNHLLGDAPGTLSDLTELDDLARRKGAVSWWVELRVRQADYYAVIGEYDAASEAAEEAIRLAQEANLPEQAAAARVILGGVYWSLGQFDQAVRHQARALEISRERGDRQAEAKALLEYGSAIWTDGDADAGVKAIQQALIIAKESGNREVEGMALNNLGYGAWAYGDYVEAVQYLQLGLDIFREIGARRETHDALSLLGRVALAREDYAQALGLYEQLIESEQETEALGNLGIALGGLGDAHAGLGHVVEAEQAYRESIELNEKYGRTERAMRIRASWARLALTQGDIDLARGLVNEVLRFVDDGGRLYGPIEPLSTWTACLVVLVATDDPRADALLSDTYARLMTLADSMPDAEARRLFLEAVPWHKEIVAMHDDRHLTEKP